MEEKEKEIFDSKKFTKTFCKKLFINFVWIGILSYILLEISQQYFPDIARILVVLLILYLVIKKIYLASITETFSLGKISANDINKITKNIIIVICLVSLIGIIFSLFSYLLSLRTISNLDSAGLIFESIMGNKEELQNNALRNFIINVIIQIATNVILAFLCVKKFKKESSKSENLT